MQYKNGIVMLIRIVLCSYLMWQGHFLDAQIGVKIQQQNNIYGTWEYIDHAQNIILVFNPDGTGSIDGDRFEYSTNDSTLSIIQGPEVVSYKFILHLKTLELNGGDLNEKIILTKIDGPSSSELEKVLLHPDHEKEDVKSVKVGNQNWSSLNLNVDQFRNGDTIKEAKSISDWLVAYESRTPCWCHYNFDPANENLYGKLYNWYAVSDFRNLAPIGWHVADLIEWRELINFLGGRKIAGNSIKNDSGWMPYKGESVNGNNISGFSALPGGYCQWNGKFRDIGAIGIWWTISRTKDDYPWAISVWRGDSEVTESIELSGKGLSVRCIKD